MFVVFRFLIFILSLSLRFIFSLKLLNSTFQFQHSTATATATATATVNRLSSPMVNFTETELLQRIPQSLTVNSNRYFTIKAATVLVQFKLNNMSTSCTHTLTLSLSASLLSAVYSSVVCRRIQGLATKNSPHSQSKPTNRCLQQMASFRISGFSPEQPSFGFKKFHTRLRDSWPLNMPFL